MEGHHRWDHYHCHSENCAHPQTRYADRKRPDTLGISLRAVGALPCRSWVAFVVAIFASTLVLLVVVLLPLSCVIFLVKWIARLLKRGKSYRAKYMLEQRGMSWRIPGTSGPQGPLRDTAPRGLVAATDPTALSSGTTTVFPSRGSAFDNNSSIPESYWNDIAGGPPPSPLASMIASVLLSERDGGDDPDQNGDSSVELVALVFDCVILLLMFFLIPTVQRGLLMDRDEAMYLGVRKTLEKRRRSGDAVLVVGAAHMAGILERIRERGI